MNHGRALADLQLAIFRALRIDRELGIDLAQHRGVESLGAPAGHRRRQIGVEIQHAGGERAGRGRPGAGRVQRQRAGRLHGVERKIAVGKFGDAVFGMNRAARRQGAEAVLRQDDVLSRPGDEIAHRRHRKLGLAVERQPVIPAGPGVGHGAGEFERDRLCRQRSGKAALARRLHQRAGMVELGRERDFLPAPQRGAVDGKRRVEAWRRQGDGDLLQFFAPIGAAVEQHDIAVFDRHILDLKARQRGEAHHRGVFRRHRARRRGRQRRPGLGEAPARAALRVDFEIDRRIDQHQPFDLDPPRQKRDQPHHEVELLEFRHRRRRRARRVGQRHLAGLDLHIGEKTERQRPVDLQVAARGVAHPRQDLRLQRIRRNKIGRDQGGHDHNRDHGAHDDQQLFHGEPPLRHAASLYRIRCCHCEAGGGRE